MNSDERECPFCRKIIKLNAKKCRFCGKWLNQAIEDYKPSTIPCPYCGEQILPTAKKCKHCQSWLSNNTDIFKSNDNISNLKQHTKPSKINNFL